MNRKIYFGHEKLDVYRIALKYVVWANDVCERLKNSNRHARDHLYRASQSIPLNIAEGNGKTSDPDRKRYFEIARGSALECAAIQDVLEVGNAITFVENDEAKELLNRIVAMVTSLSKTSYCVKEDTMEFVDRDSDCDNDRD